MVVYRPFGAFRFMLALAVVVSHAVPLEAPESFLAAMGIGNVAVMGFFVLSGFIIAEAADRFYPDRPGAFLSNRFWRIAPPYWAALIVSIAAHATLLRFGIFQPADTGTPTDAMFTIRNVWSNIIAIFPRPGRLQVDVPGGFYGFVRFYWAIYIELEFYLVVFITMALMRAARRRYPVAEFVITLAIVAHALNEYVRPLPLHAELGFVPYFSLGVCLYTYSAHTGAASRFGVVISYILAALHFSRYIQGKNEIGAAWQTAVLNPENAAALACFLIVPILTIGLGKFTISDAAANADRRLGDLTYPIYLNHFVVLVIARSFDWRFNGAVVAVAVLAILLATILSAAVDKPLKPLRDRIRGRQLVPATPVS